MFRAATRPPGDRKAIILLVVVVLLTLFAVIGLSFLLFAENEANVARIAREGESKRENVGDTAPIPDDAAGRVIASIIFPDDNPDSVLRGWDLARAVYGWSQDNGAPNASDHRVPYNGLGRVRTTSVPLDFGTVTPPAPGDYWINHSRQQVGTNWIMRDPERSGAPVMGSAYSQDWRVSANAADLDITKPPLGNYVAINAPHTYPDLKDLYLATIRPSDGKVLVPSYERPWVFGQWMDPANPTQPNPTNPNLTNPYGKYLTLRPRPQDHIYNGTTEFPYPVRSLIDGTEGDVENFDGKYGLTNSPEPQNDSMWMDAGLPTQYLGSKIVKPLVAILVTDLDGRLNMNTVANLVEVGQTPASNQGWGGWETNPFYSDGMGRNGTLGGIAAPNTPNPLAMFTDPNRGLYASLGQPFSQGFFTVKTEDRPKGKFYSRIDWDASTTTVITPPAMPPGPPTVTAPPPGVAAGAARNAFPTFPDRFENDTAEMMSSHARFYNPYASGKVGTNLTQASARNRFLPSSDMGYFMKRFTYADPAEATFNSAELAKSYPATMTAPALFGDNTKAAGRNRMLHTTFSNDFSRPGFFPWSSTPGTFTQPAQTTDPTTGVLLPVPQPSGPATLSPSPQVVGMDPTLGSAAPYDFQANNLRSKMPNLVGPIDMNRPLPDYQIQNGVAQMYTQATQARQLFAKDIFTRLAYATGLGDVVLLDPTARPQEYAAGRWLAQLAVNIVDQIDDDDVMTPFNWTAGITAAAMKNEWVYGNELNRLVITEAYSQYENDPMDPNKPFHDAIAGPPMQPASYATRYKLNFWVELHNPLTPPNGTDPTLIDGGGARLYNTQASHPVYQLDLRTYKSKNLRRVDNTDGRPDTTMEAGVTAVTPGTMPNEGPYETERQTVDLSNGNPNMAVVPPSNGQLGKDYVKTTGTDNPAFVLIGAGDVPTNATGGVKISSTDANFKDRFSVPLDANGKTAMQINIPKALIDATPGFQTALKPAVFLRRLACPWMAPEPDNTKPNYNPYITVDYLEDITMNNGLEVGGATTNALVKMATRKTYDQRKGDERFQPYAGFNDPNLRGVVDQMYPSGEDKNINHNFFGFSQTKAAAQFFWPAHLDRKLLSPAELFLVSAYKPSEFTQQFVSPFPLPPATMPTPALKPHQHLADWRADDKRLFRALGLLTTPSWMEKMARLGRMPGLVNINTLTDPAVFMSMAAPSPTGNRFTATDVQNAFTAIINQRDANGTQPGPNSLPFLPPGVPITGMADPNFGPGAGTPVGLNRTLLDLAAPAMGTTLSPAERSPKYFPVTYSPTETQHPALTNELMNKLYNRLTTRSNSFAVWFTIGYFEVRNIPEITANPATRPILGREYANAQGERYRYKYFGLVDRTNIRLDPNSTEPPAFFPVANAKEITGSPMMQQTIDITLPLPIFDPPPPGLTGPTTSYEGRNTLFVKGQQVFLGEDGLGEGRELVTITNVTAPQYPAAPAPPIPGQIQVKSSQYHPANTMISTTLIGNPGKIPPFVPGKPGGDPPAYKGVLLQFERVN